MIAAGAGITTRLLEHPSFVWLGDRSYSWYFWHWPAIVLGAAMLPVGPGDRGARGRGVTRPVGPVVFATSSSGSASAEANEGGRTAPRLAAVSIAVPFLVLTVALLGSNRQWGLEQ